MSDKVYPATNNMGQGDTKNHPDADKDSHRLDLNKDQLANGPVMNRGCTDIICCFLFIAFFVGMCGTAAYGFINGDPMLLLTGWDYDGNGCGYNSTTKDFGYLYWPAPDVSAISSDYYQAFKYSMCVKECPSSESSDPVLCKEPSFFGQNVKFKNCTYYPSAYTYSNGTVYYGTPMRYGTQKILNKYCLPDTEAAKQTTIKEFKERFYDTYNVDKFTDYVMDLVNCWQVMLICVGAAFIIGMIYLIILRCCVGVIVWFTIFGTMAAMGAGGYWVYKTKDNYEESDNNHKYLTYGAYAIWGIAGAFLLLVLCCCGRIRLAVAIMKVTSQFIYNTPTVLLLPIIFLIICGIWVAAWTFTAVYIFSVGDIQPRDSPLSFVTTVKWSNQTRYIFLYHLFGGLWVNAFLIGCSQFIIAAACCIWYFSFTSDTSGKGSLCQGLKWIFRYHFGSIAFGSFIIAVVQFIRIIFEYYRKKIQAANKNNPVIKCMLCCTGYCLKCLERCVKFITKNAYIQVAISSKNFCRSAWNAFLLVIRNAARFGFVHSLGGIFMFLGRLFIICCTVICCYVMLMYWPYFHDRISSPYFPCIIAGIIGYLIGAIFMSIFSFSSDTILQCFFLDEELGDDAKGRPPNNRPPIMSQFISKASNGKRCCCC